MMANNKRFTNRVTRSVLEIRSPHFYVRLSQARAVQKSLGFVFPSTDRVTRLVNLITNQEFQRNPKMLTLDFSWLQIYLRPGKVPFATVPNIRLAC